MENFLDAEKDLILKIQEGDMAAFRKLVDTYKERAVKISYSVMGNFADAEDAAQEAFVRVYNNIDKFRLDSRFSTWLYRILINICRDLLRKKKSAHLVLGQENEFQFSEKPIDNKNNDPAQVLLNKELMNKINLALCCLSEKQKLVFALKHKQGFKIEEIAEMMNTTESTVKVHLFRAVRQMQKKLQPYLSEQNSRAK